MSVTTVLDAPTTAEFARIVDRLSRRGFLTGAGALGATALLGACGTADAGDEASAAPATRTVTTPLGTYEIPVSPQRVVVVDSRLDLEPALALELPVIAHSYDAPAPWLPGTTAKEIASPVNFEEVLALAPDLIVCVNLDIDTWPARALLEIAPVVTTEFTVPWKENMNRLAGWLGRTDTFDRAMGRYDDAAARLVDRHADTLRDAGIGIVAFYDPKMQLVHDPVAMMPPQVLVDLGGRLGDIGGRSGHDAIERERLEDLAGLDAIMVMAPRGDIGALADDPLWQRVPAVADGRIHIVDDRTYYGSIYSAIELVVQFDALLTRLG